MDLDGTSEMSQRKTNTICYHLYVQSKNKWQTVTKQKQAHRYREQTSDYQWGGRGKIGVGD